MTKKKDAEQFRKSKIDNFFNLVKKDDKVHIVVGDKCVSNKKFDTFEQADKYIGTKPYELIFNINYLICMHYVEEKIYNMAGTDEGKPTNN